MDVPLERDEGEYAYAGQLILQGVPPYRLAYNMKLPGTYAAYAGIMAVFGQTVRGIHLGLLLVNLAAAALLFLLGRRLFHDDPRLVAGLHRCALRNGRCRGHRRGRHDGLRVGQGGNRLRAAIAIRGLRLPARVIREPKGQDRRVPPRAISSASRAAS